jgi:hypothetical protein
MQLQQQLLVQPTRYSIGPIAYWAAQQVRKLILMVCRYAHL